MQASPRDAQGEQGDHGAADRGVLADSEATMPSMMPVPNSSGCLDVFGHHIGENVGGAAADAGQNADADADEADRKEVGDLGPNSLMEKRSLSRPWCWGAVTVKPVSNRPCWAAFSSSATANRPMSTGRVEKPPRVP